MCYGKITELLSLKHIIGITQKIRQPLILKGGQYEVDVYRTEKLFVLVYNLDR
jgi:hypothetical protein